MWSIRPISVDVQSAGLIGRGRRWRGRTDIGLIGCVATGSHPQNSHQLVMDRTYKPGPAFSARHPFPPPFLSFSIRPVELTLGSLRSFVRDHSL